jgi:pyruvate dehydrogenase E2 component (dihydrolipoamide acetyltransferase)
MAIEIKLPVLGDNIDSGDVLEVKVQEGDQIQKDQGILEIETDKATVEVPSTHAGKVLKVHIKDGQTIRSGAPLITLEESSESGKKPAARQKKEEAAQPESPPRKETAKPGASDGAAKSSSGEKPESGKSASPPESRQPAAGQQAMPSRTEKRAPTADEDESAVPDPGESDQAEEAESAEKSQPEGVIPAGPAIRRFAREVGVDLSGITGSGPGGRILREDVLSLVRTANELARGKSSTDSGEKAEEGEHDAWGPVRIEKLSKIRRTIAAKMAESWSSAPRVTNFDDADVTELERIRQSSKEDYAADGIKLTSLPFVIKAVAMSLRKHPTVNASIDIQKEQVTFKQYVHIGVAVDTDRGLVVPALRHAERLSIPEIAKQLAQLAEKVRSGSFSVDDLRGSTFTISNLGAVGGTYSTPMINVPEVAILLLGRSRKMPVVLDDKIVIRLVMPLSLSYDHRLVDGAEAARFLNDVKGYVESPSRLLLAP